MGSKIVISIEFLEDLIELPKDIQKKTIDFLYKFDKNPHSPGINLEKINIVNDKQLYSVRIDLTYRGIVYIDKQEIYHLLWVKHHHEVYGYIDQKNDVKLGNLSVYNKDYYDKLGITKNKTNKLFSSVSNNELLSYGLEEKNLPLVRSFESIADLQEMKDSLHNDMVHSYLVAKAYKILSKESMKPYNSYKKELIDILNNEVLSPALKPESGLDQKTKDSVKRTLEMIKSKKFIHEIINFYEDAKKLKSGQYIRDKLKEKDLQTFEDIEQKIIDFLNRINSA